MLLRNGCSNYQSIAFTESRVISLIAKGSQGWYCRENEWLLNMHDLTKSASLDVSLSIASLSNLYMSVTFFSFFFSYRLISQTNCIRRTFLPVVCCGSSVFCCELWLILWSQFVVCVIISRRNSCVVTWRAIPILLFKMKAEKQLNNTWKWCNESLYSSLKSSHSSMIQQGNGTSLNFSSKHLWWMNQIESL